MHSLNKLLVTKKSREKTAHVDPSATASIDHSSTNLPQNTPSPLPTALKAFTQSNHKYYGNGNHFHCTLHYFPKTPCTDPPFTTNTLLIARLCNLRDCAYLFNIFIIMLKIPTASCAGVVEYC